MTEKQRRVIEAARLNPARFIEVAKVERPKRFTAFDNMLAKMTPERQSELHARAREAWAEKDRLSRKPDRCPALSAEQERLIKTWND